MNFVFLGDLSAVTGLHNLLGIGAGSILLPPVQTSALGMPLLQSPDGAMSLLSNIQVYNCYFCLETKLILWSIYPHAAQYEEACDASSDQLL